MLQQLMMHLCPADPLIWAQDISVPDRRVSVKIINAQARLTVSEDTVTDDVSCWWRLTGQWLYCDFVHKVLDASITRLFNEAVILKCHNTSRPTYLFNFMEWKCSFGQRCSLCFCTKWSSAPSLSPLSFQPSWNYSRGSWLLYSTVLFNNIQSSTTDA